MICASCIRCFVDRQEERISKTENEALQAFYMKEVCRIVAQAGEEDSVPVLVERINRVYREHVGALDDYTEIKREYNELMLSVEKRMEEKVRAKKDPLQAAMLYARAANYIDFGAFNHVNHETLFELLDQAAGQELAPGAYSEFLAELETAKSLVYVTDNCGEVVMDKIVMKLLKEMYPQLRITALIRGMQALNDVTKEDAGQVDLYSVAEVVTNGCGVTGTPIAYISEEARALLEDADVIVAKGQGNFETMNGCGLNVYYSFFCKCDWFQKRFGLPRNTGVFIREKGLCENREKGLCKR